MKIFLFFLFTCVPFFLIAQATQFVVESFQLDWKDLEATRNPVYDANDKKCALIKVRTDLRDLTFSSNNGIVAQKMMLTEYWVYVSHNEKILNIYKEGFSPLNYNIPLGLEENKVYTFYVTTNKRFGIVIQTEPKNARLWFKGQQQVEANIQDVSPGSYPIKIACDGYLPIDDTIHVGEGSIFFSYSMEKLEPVLLTVTSEPVGSTLIIDNEYKGQTPKQIFMYPGEYSMQISNEFHQTIKERVRLTKMGANKYHYKLRLNTSHLLVKTVPADAQVFCDGKLLMGKTKIEGGEHLIEVKSPMFYSHKGIVNIASGSDTLINIGLLAKVGKLQFTVNPIHAEASLYREEKLINSWSGAKRIEDLQIGPYTLIVDAKKYKKLEQQIEIKENEIEELFLDLAIEEPAPENKLYNPVLLSLAVPGLGQYYSGFKIRSLVYGLSALGTGSLAIYYNLQFNKMLDNYEKSKLAYTHAMELPDINYSRGQMDGYYDELTNIANKRQLFFLSFVYIYGLNVMDAIIFKKKPKSSTDVAGKTNKQIHMVPLTFNGGLGFQLTYSF